jgi:hypothetical protein
VSSTSSKRISSQIDGFSTSRRVETDCILPSKTPADINAATANAGSRRHCDGRSIPKKGVDNRGAKPRIPIERLSADFEAGMDPSQIARKHGMSREAVRWRLNQWKPGCVARRRRHLLFQRQVDRTAEARREWERRISRNRKVVDFAKRGVPFDAIGRACGITGSMAARVAKKLGLPARRAETRQRDAEWLAMHEKGLTLKEVAERVGKPCSTVREGIVRARDGYVFRERMFDR